MEKSDHDKKCSPPAAVSIVTPRLARVWFETSGLGYWGGG